MPEAAISDISTIYHEVPTLEGLDVCFGGGCAEIRHISISSLEWVQVVAIFANKTADDSLKAELERRQVAEAVGKLETIVGAKTGTSGDRAGTFNNSNFPGQLDCNDEAINTLTYIHLMQYYGLVNYMKLKTYAQEVSSERLATQHGYDTRKSYRQTLCSR